MRTSTQQDFDFYKKVLGLDNSTSKPRASVFNVSAKSSVVADDQQSNANAAV